MGEVEAKKGRVTRHDLRHDRHTVSLLTDHIVFSPKYRGKVLLGDVAEVAEEISWIAKRIKGRSSKLIRDQFPQLKEWCPGHLGVPSCYQKTFKKSFIKNASQSVGHGWEVVEKYISGQKGLEKTDVIRGERGEGSGKRYSYEKADTAPVAVIDEEKEKTHKTLYTSLYNKLLGREHQK